MNGERKSHPKNAEGPFYVEDGMCLSCRAAQEQAPALMGYDEEGAGHCYIRRQPANDEETYRAVRALWSSEARAIRYRGDDLQVLRRIAELGLADMCDHPVPEASWPVLRNYVTFEVVTSSSSSGSSRPSRSW